MSVESKTVKVVHYQRRPRPNANYSLEYIFEDIRTRLADSVSIVRVGAPSFSNGVLNRLKIMWHARANQGDVTHVTGDINFAAILLRRRTTILTVLDCGFVNRTQGLKRWLLKWIWLNLPVRCVARVTTISTAAKQEIVKLSGCDPSLVEVIPVAISPAFTYTPKKFDSQFPSILQIGTAPNKNTIRLIDAIKDLNSELTIVGKLNEQLIAQLEKTNIKWRNLVSLSQEEVVDEYRRCDMLAFCSTYEGFGMPILEAQATGRPVLTSNVSSMPEVAGNAACLVDPFDISSIRSGIESIIQDGAYRKSLVERGLENVKRFDADVIAKQYLALYLRIADQES